MHNEFMRWALVSTLGFGCGSTNAVATTSDASGTWAAAEAGQALSNFDHVVVIILENGTFDSLYAEFPGADGSGGRSPHRD